MEEISGFGEGEVVLGRLAQGVVYELQLQVLD